MPLTPRAHTALLLAQLLAIMLLCALLPAMGANWGVAA